jgi:hypothetical protein
MIPAWREVLRLDSARRVVAGSPAALRQALAAGADLRIATEFRHNEHIETASDDDELVRESMDMRLTYVIDQRWAAGAVTLRQPVALPGDFGPRPSMSFFLYNEDGGQAIARPHLDGPPAPGRPGPSPAADHAAMPRYHEQDRYDDATNAPSSNFIYDFDHYRYCVREDWTLVFAHDAKGSVQSGSLNDLTEAFNAGAEVKVGISGLCDDLAAGPPLAHMAYIQAGACYYYTRRKLFIAATHPLVRVRPAIPMRYTSRGWDFGWLIVRTDGQVARLLYDPYTLQPRRDVRHCALHWFCR